MHLGKLYDMNGKLERGKVAGMTLVGAQPHDQRGSGDRIRKLQDFTDLIGIEICLLCSDFYFLFSRL